MTPRPTLIQRPTLPPAVAPSGRPRRRWGRVLVALAASLLLHFIAVDMVRGHIGTQATAAAPSAVITAALTPAPAPVVAEPPPAAPAKPVVPKPPRAARRPPTLTPAPATPSVAPDETSVVAALPEPTSTPLDTLPPVALTEAVPATPPSEPATTAAAAHTATALTETQFKLTLPPSVEITYDVTKLRETGTVYGNGKITWRSDGTQYSIDGEAGILFFSVLTFRSEGTLEAEGITPLRYAEKRLGKPETNTHFQRTPKLISFSASTLSYPRNGGEQDRASVVWQLAAIGRGDPSQMVPGVTFAIFVAGIRDGEIWPITVLGEEAIELGGAKIPTWHLQRKPQDGSYDTQVDIWLAPTREWYPVRLRQTERNGEYLDMSMSKIVPL